MAKPTKKTDGIETLLAEKNEIEQWLEKLNAAGNKTPKHVRDKVAGDYQSRLDKVLEELQGFRDEIVSGLQTQEGESSRLREVEAAASERYAEAELRHSVGEYDESSWSTLSSEIQTELDDVRKELDAVEAAITKLQGIAALIDENPVAVTELNEVPELESEASAVAGTDEIAELDGAEDEIADLPERPSDQTEAFDEMAFLKSVTEDDDDGPDAAQASGSRSAVDLKRSRGKKVGAQGVEAVSSTEDGPVKGKVKKSLKCGECGAKNLPTEWYCERCGAELAAL